LDKDWCVTPLDAVIRIEDRGVNDRPKPLARGICRVRGNERVDEDLVPLQYLVGIVGRSPAGRYQRQADGSGQDDAREQSLRTM
jgi:hypothetical protein